VDGGYDDDALVDALRNGDDSAFGWLVDTYSASLHRVAMNFVTSPSLADDVVQETWLGVIKGIDGFEQRSSLKTWIYRILMNIARTRGSRERRTVPFSSVTTDDGFDGVFPDDRFRRDGEEWAGWWADPAAPWEPAEQFDRAETMRRVRDAIACLPPSQRIVISLRDVDGWCSEDVCSLLEITPVNQRVLLHRARAGVRVRLDPYFEAVER
jgi:RNA polymerase sigma-70 factor (ECF subfamily)